MVPRKEHKNRTAYDEEARNILQAKDLKPKKAKIKFGGGVELTSHNLDNDARYSDATVRCAFFDGIYTRGCPLSYWFTL
jgi:hypothetical protein